MYTSAPITHASTDGTHTMASNEKTSAAVAKIASKGLMNPASLTSAEIKKLAASALTQAADKPKKKKEEGEKEGCGEKGEAQGGEEEAVTRSAGALARRPPLI